MVRPNTRLFSSVLFAVSLAACEGESDPDVAPELEGHGVTFINNCDQQVWLAEFGSTSVAPANWALAPTCTADNASSVCASGQSCSDGACTCSSADDCRFGAPVHTTTASCEQGVCVNKTTLDLPSGWSGRFWPRTGCSGMDAAFVCETGQCGPSSGGNIDCTTQNSAANLATLFELATADVDGVDDYDVSLVSGYNIEVTVEVTLAEGTPVWTANTAYTSGDSIIQTLSGQPFRFTSNMTGTSGAQAPAFPDQWLASVSDGTTGWVNTGPVCTPSGCTSDLLATCPDALKVESGQELVACDAPANACVPGSSSCHGDLSYFQCQHNGGATDLSNDVLTLQSPNAGTFVCFSAEDCPAGTSCSLDPSFESGFTLPVGTGVCTPVAQNGGCTPTDDGSKCPAINFPFVDYQCQTLSGVTANAQVCIPPTTSGFGSLWWNAANWSPMSGASSCTKDDDCKTPMMQDNKCLAPLDHGGYPQCDGSDCSCYEPQTCSSARGANDGCPGANQCLNGSGVPDGGLDKGVTVDCSNDTCYCGPQGVYSGSCGPTNPDWNSAGSTLTSGGASWPSNFKAACPVAYSYQFDDPSSNWSCPNSSTDLVDYTVTFCATL